jgi:hypothetical protein
MGIIAGLTAYFSFTCLRSRDIQLKSNAFDGQCPANFEGKRHNRHLLILSRNGMPLISNNGFLYHGIYLFAALFSFCCLFWFCWAKQDPEGYNRKNKKYFTRIVTFTSVNLYKIVQ